MADTVQSPFTYDSLNARLSGGAESEDAAYYTYRLFKESPDEFYTHLDAISNRLKPYALKLQDVICDEIIKDYGNADREKTLLVVDSLFSRFNDRKDQKQQFDDLQKIKRASYNCIRDSPEESDPGLLK